MSRHPLSLCLPAAIALLLAGMAVNKTDHRSMGEQGPGGRPAYRANPIVPVLGIRG